MIDKLLLAKIKAWFVVVFMSLLALVAWLMLLTTPFSIDWIIILWFNLGILTPFAIYYTWRLNDKDTPFWEKIRSSLLLSILFSVVLFSYLVVGILGSIKIVVEWGYEIEDFQEISLVLSDKPTYSKDVSYNKYTGLRIQEIIHLPQAQHKNLNFTMPDALVEIINHEKIIQEISVGDTIFVVVHQNDIRKKIKRTGEPDFLNPTGIDVYGIRSNSYTYLAFNETTLDIAVSKSWFFYFIIIGDLVILPIYLMYRVVINRRKYNQQNPWRLG